MLIRDLAPILFGAERSGTIMVLNACFDGSGKWADPVVTVGGYFGPARVCEKLENEWASALLKAGMVDPDGSAGVFHYTDFGTEHCGYGTGAWAIPKRVDLLKQLGELVSIPDIVLASVSVDRSEYIRFLQNTPHGSIYGPPFSGCAQLVFSLVERVLADRGIQAERVAYIFEKGDRQHEMHRSFDEYEKAHPSLSDKRTLTLVPKREPLAQAADLVSGIVQEVLVRAYGALGFLDNGCMLTPLDKFEKYYAFDGRTGALLKAEDKWPFCFVANRKLFDNVDAAICEAVHRNPSILLDREKPRINQGKRHRQRRLII